MVKLYETLYAAQVKPGDTLSMESTQMDDWKVVSIKTEGETTVIEAIRDSGADFTFHLSPNTRLRTHREA